MRYAVRILRAAQKQLASTPPSAKSRIIAALRSLAGNPRPHGYKKLTGRPAYRIRVGTYRIIYEVHDEEIFVLVIAIGHRRDVYR